MNDIWKSLASRLSEAEDLPRRPDYSTLPKTTDVIDEEKSVRWNREEVERRRKEWIVKRNTLLRKRNNAVGVVQNDIILQIQKELEEETGKPVGKVVATLLWNKAYERGHAGGFYEIYAAIEDYEELVIDALKGKSTKTYYVIANEKEEFFSYDKMTGGYPYFGKYHESAEHFQTAEKAEEFLLHSNYTTNQFHDTFAKCSVKKVTITGTVSET